MAHYHIRLRLPGDTDYVAVSQLYFSDSDVDQYRTVGIYSADTDPVTYSTMDGIYKSVDPQIRDLLTLSINGDYQTSVNSELSLALVTDVSPVAASSPTMPVAPSQTTLATSPIAAPVGSPNSKASIQGPFSIMTLLQASLLLLLQY